MHTWRRQTFQSLNTTPYHTIPCYISSTISWIWRFVGNFEGSGIHLTLAKEFRKAQEELGEWGHLAPQHSLHDTLLIQQFPRTFLHPLKCSVKNSHWPEIPTGIDPKFWDAALAVPWWCNHACRPIRLRVMSKQTILPRRRARMIHRWRLKTKKARMIRRKARCHSNLRGMPKTQREMTISTGLARKLTISTSPWAPRWAWLTPCSRGISWAKKVSRSFSPLP